MRLLAYGILFVLCSTWAALAQDTDVPAPAVLVADEVSISSNRVLIARGNVEAFQGQTRLRAKSITYDDATGQMIINGPIVIEEGPDILILASQAELSSDLRNGLLIGARLVLSQQLQLASVELGRVDGRYTQLFKTAVTSCQVCENDSRPPLWQIRARRVIHDQEERQLYFDGAQLRVRNVPIFYLPRLRLPDPTLERASGFLIPSIQSTSQLGTGIKVPYFFKIGDHRDLTLTPYYSTSTRTLEFRYRQAFVRGRIQFDGAITRDDIREGATRGYLFGTGSFQLNRGYKLTFDIQTTTDESYLLDYSYSDLDRLRNEVSIDRARRDQYTGFVLTNYRSLRDGEDNSTLPTNAIEGFYEKRFFPSAIGGEFRLNAEGHAHFRESDLDVDGPDEDSIADGRDILRFTFGADWRRSWITRGLETQVRFGVVGDTFRVNNDAAFDESDSEVTPYGTLTLRYPLVRSARGGARQLLEPVAQIAWSGGDGLDVPNEESTFVEFDEGNLLSLSRFPSVDRRERGTVAAFGVNWAHYAPSGWQSNITVGQVRRSDDTSEFSNTSGLFGNSSDYLFAGQIKTANGLALTARSLFDNTFEFAKAEIRGDWHTNRFNIGGSYVYLDEDAEEDRDESISEFNFDGIFNLNDVWSASVDWRYDFGDGRASRAGVGVGYTNECVRMDFSVDRRFTSSTSVEAQTSFGLTLSLRGFSTSPGTAKHVRACGKNAS
ncbi:MAG: LPS assembly protein LptD [Paracoccaceae bacterium]